MADIEQGAEESAFMPVELVYVPISIDVPSDHQFKLQIPLKALENAQADGKVHKV
jgi:hypothetical protein